ncbi:hypothetical protein H5410_061869 [Solanum commersonii]|uniref:Uncharacterized protein n=1 Tax=Solanum commersonii TaxID=4109 RepID=A0A9J5W9W0_SOLCO|nr:hypothetical protein H5410_061869 [Solanum commersonii]
MEMIYASSLPRFFPLLVNEEEAMSYKADFKLVQWSGMMIFLPFRVMLYLMLVKTSSIETEIN